MSHSTFPYYCLGFTSCKRACHLCHIKLCSSLVSLNNIQRSLFNICSSLNVLYVFISKNCSTFYSELMLEHRSGHLIVKCDSCFYLFVVQVQFEYDYIIHVKLSAPHIIYVKYLHLHFNVLTDFIVYIFLI